MNPPSDSVLAAIEAAVDDNRGVVLLLDGPVDAALEGALAGSFDVPGARGAFATKDERFDDPDALIAKVVSTLPRVLILEDLDLGLPTLNWSDYFLLRALPPVLEAHPLVVVATTGSAGIDPAIVAELAERGLARRIDAAPSAPDEQDGDDARAQLHRAFAPLGEDPAAKGYAVAVQTLRIAALEGPVFTVSALARVLGEDEDALSDLLDDHLVFDDDHPDAPLDGLGFVDVPGGSAFRYGFRDRRFWTVMHPVHGSGAWPSSPPMRRFARKYSDALANLYGPFAPEALYRVWELSRLAGDGQGQPYAWLGNALGDVDDRVRLLIAEAETQTGPHASRDPQVMLAGTRRILQHTDVAAAALSPEDLLRYAQLARALLAGAEDELPADVRPRAWSDVYQLLAAAARVNGRLGDAARCEAERLALVDPANALAKAHQTTMVAEALLPLLTVSEWAAAAPTHIDLSVPWLDEYLRADIAPAKARARLTDRLDGLLNEATGALAGVGAQERRHTEAHVLHARAGVARSIEQPDRARDLDERALELLSGETDDDCGIRAAVLAHLT